MADYSKTIIYKIINYDRPDLVYVGTTTNFTTRKYQHKTNSSNIDIKYKIYENIRATGGWESWQMVQICEYPCNNKKEAEAEKDRYMIDLKANLNTNRASRTIKEYYIDNKEHILEQRKLYREQNKEAINERVKQNRQDNKEKMTCECGSIIQHTEKARHSKSIKHQKYVNTIL